MKKHNELLNYLNTNATDSFSDLEIDENYKELVNQFMSTLKASYNRVNIKKTIYDLYFFLLENEKLTSKADSSLNIKIVTLENILKFQAKIELRVNSNEIKRSYAKNLLLYIRLFCKFLTENNIVKIFYKPVNFLKVSVSKQENELAPILKKFLHFLSYKNYTHTNSYVKSINMFLNFIGLQVDENILFTEKQIKNYEEYLRIKIVKEELKPSSVYSYLKSIRLFFDFLYSEKFINFKYVIPSYLVNHSIRSNEYVNENDFITFIDSILAFSKHTLRDLSIVLILLETGCRPIEVVNLNIDDIVLNERLINLKSKKSHQRRLILSKDVIEIIKSYLKIRSNYLPQGTNESLFLNFNGVKITTNTIYGIFSNFNKYAFGRLKFSPKSLRHTYITNALNNKNSLEQVSKAVGHKYLSSTLYYFYRDLNSIRQIANDKELNIVGVK